MGEGEGEREGVERMDGERREKEEERGRRGRWQGEDIEGDRKERTGGRKEIQREKKIENR